ncbi:hypothetical protein ST47_g6488 [Ascochyta rabiei]|uniref:Uncharacterized protein n=1 Tax=Didymella rabiei TaxID=5454 RepID=A0A163CD80_DIDRA|nr:hypothetical protein ST47_g6488 [Ascochyta rabiei]
MVCTVCQDMLQSQVGRVWKGTYDLRYSLPTSIDSLQEQSLGQACNICRALCEGLQQQKLVKSSKVSRRQDSFSETSQQILSETVTEPSLEIAASLSVQNVDFVKNEHLYRLDVVLQERKQKQHLSEEQKRKQKQHLGREQERAQQQIRVQRTFLLENPKAKDSALHPRTSPSTSSKEVFDTAVNWMNKCKCAADQPQSFYPARLLSLEDLKIDTDNNWETIREPSGGPVWESLKERPDFHVKLVETQSWFYGEGEKIGPGFRGGNTRYVTLSHCWGRAVKPQHQLTSETEQGLRQGIPISRLPKTFRDAIYFAAQIEDVGYIWIDSLCIRQGDKEDWLHQSGDMDRVYRGTYLNLSATASSDSEGGLFKYRDPSLLKEEEVELNIEGVPGAHAETSFISHSQDKSSRQRGKDAKQNYMRPCTVLDASFWTDRVDKGPVNTRGWIAWECRGSKGCAGFDFTEGQPHGMSNFKLTNRGIVEVPRLKALNIDNYPVNADHAQPQAGDSDNVVRLTDPALKDWARIIETYSKTSITKLEDRLIALSGMAKMMAEKSMDQYVAGLWRTNLASQLLWRVEPHFDYLSKDFSNPAKSPDGYRAPSFSWAAIEVDGHGVMYTDRTYRRLFITIDDVKVEPHDKNNKFGLVDEAKIRLYCKLREAKIRSVGTNGRYEWQLVGRGRDKALNRELHTNIYLDCPLRDKDCISTSGKTVYVVPAAIDQTGDMICLILRLQDKETGVFTRMGITKLSPFWDKLAMDETEDTRHRILEVYPGDIDLPHDGVYDEDEGRHRICLI